MIILVLGLVLIVVGALSINFVALSKDLKTYDEAQWKALGSPQGFSFLDWERALEF